MGLDIGVITGKIEYLDRASYGHNPDLGDFLDTLFSSGVGEVWPTTADCNAFLFIGRRSWRQAVAERARDIRQAREAPYRIHCFITDAMVLFNLMALLSPHGDDEVLIHASW